MSFKRCQSSLFLPISIAIALAPSTIAEIPRDSIQFPSSIALHGGYNDISLRPQQSFHQRNAQQDGSQILHSHIDRDPIDIYDSDFLHNELDFDVRDVFLQHQWQSPLEQISPIRSQHYDPITFTSKPSSTLAHDERRHIHQSKAISNNLSLQNNLQLKTRKTGTTITALVACNSTVLILAADTRATDGTTVADSRCEKLHQLARNVWCAGAGTSGDVEAIVRSIKFMFWKRGLSNEVGNLGRSIPYVTSNNEENVPLAPLPAILHCLRTQLQKSRGQLGVNLLVGGYDPVSQRATLAAIHPHGSMDVITYGALGSGGLAATGILESRYPKIGSGQCTLEEGIHLAVDAVRAGVENDLGSGSQVDVCIITKEGVLYRRAVVEEETLEWFDKNKDINDVSRMQMTNNVGGVNGFGNIPFAIQSEKVVVSAELHSTQAKRQWLDNILRTDEQENK